MQQEPRPLRRPLPPPNNTGGGAANVADRWVAQLRRQAKQGGDREDRSSRSRTASGDGTTPINGGGASGRTGERTAFFGGKQQPPSSQTLPSRPANLGTDSLGRLLPSNPSLLSVESQSQPSANATASTQNPPPSPRRHATQPPYHSSHPRSHQNSLPPPPSNTAPMSNRHRDQLERVYGSDSHSTGRNAPRYDAEFDRGLGASSRQSTSAAAAPPAKLYNPDARATPRLAFVPPPPSAAPLANNGPHQSAEDISGSRSPRQRTRRDPVDPSQVGTQKLSQDSLEDGGDEPDGLANGRAGSKSSKESKRSKRREERRREQEESGAANVAAPRGLFNPRTDNPLSFGTAAGASGGGGPGSTKSSTRKPRDGADGKSLVSTSSMVSGLEQAQDAKAGASRADATPFVNELKRVLRDIVSLEKRLQDDHRAVLVASQREDEMGAGVRIQGGPKKYDDTYWVKLASAHKELADSHYSFLQMALDSRHPASLQGLPKKYNIPSRLWTTAFHQLLERMRHAVASPSIAEQGTSANVLEHLVEFIQYAYGFYTQLYEEKDLELFRPLWIEQLGDLSRYRMAVAGLASRVAAASQSSQQGTSFNLITGRGEGRAARPFDAASIGEAALGDWELEEQETWKTMARDWYSQGVKEAPGNGRLQHHLALLSKGDELRSLYHYSKSLTTTHPYASARESILPLFEDELQARRTQPDVTKAELFVHLHGMLFTKISLDDFDFALERFLERLSQEALIATKGGADWSELETGLQAPFGDAEWFMMGVINIAALMQYGAEDGVLKRSSTKETAIPAPKAAGVVTPQAIMLNPKRAEPASSFTNDDEDGGSQSGDSAGGEVVMRLATTSEDPLVFRLAQRLTFTLLELALRFPSRPVGDARLTNPYLVLILTFLSTMLQHPASLRHLERAIPWQKLVAFLDTISPNSMPEFRTDGPVKLLGSPLPEDWCIRGMEWTGRHLFSRGFWKSADTSAGRSDEMLPPPIGPPSGATNFSSEMDALKIDLAALNEMTPEGDGESVPTQLAAARWKRLANVAAWLVKAVPGLDYDRGRFAISGGLDTKLRRWKQEDEEMAEAERQSLLSVRGHDGVDEDEVEEESDEEDDDDPSDSPAVRELKARRRELKAVIKQARQASRKPLSSLRGMSRPKQKKHHANRPALPIFAGYTVLVFDTNILLSSMKLFRELVEAEKWTVVVPLAVITELDGLRNNPAPLGTSAEEAVAYLETAIRTFPRHLKVQTSRGNYLKDLSIRSESIDFAGGADGFSHDFARSMDDVILRAVAWQKDHFSSRLALVNPGADRRAIPSDATTVVLLTFDRNLRLKARARGLDAADEKGMSVLVEQHG